ncbi:Tetratricopeptide repeat-like superfamily protein [Hibiscus syriacus]|uniref:Tetratricopeptide repeat-like superfamily protein n=1 Tax=Hibiscus syriacus TaxID=106335 RepID=A0A6A2ZFS3_HIBSY|nr:pentatricopeptide repeat-containing protein At5g18950-like [Hibiscus syriacus]KAE8690497.1 Tetratricopeptide repeat-like superfamily protein [Hibiscus syriacus]
MAKPSSFLLNFLRQNPRTAQNPNTQIRYLTIESKETSFIVKESLENQKQCKELLNDSISESDLAIVKQVSKITRTMPRWEETLLSIFPSFNFSEPWFFRELVIQQENVFFSLHFFHWLRSRYEFSPDFDSCNLLFDKLVEAKACKAARNFLHQTGLDPKPHSLECYLRCLCENKLVEEAVDVLSILNKIGYCPSIATWNLALLACLRVGRNDLFWKLYQDMIESGVGANIDVGTLGCLIQAFCIDGKASKGFELLQQILVDGLVPDTAAFRKLIAAFCKTNNYGRVSQLLHTMIATGRAPDIHTYQEVINGLCKNKKWLEGFRIFNDLKDRGYVLDRVMYTTMIHGLCKIGSLREARKLWFEMINMGMLPNEYTYSALLYGLYKVHDLKEAKRLYKEMLEKGYGETTVSYNTMIAGFCFHGETDEAYRLFKEMPQKGIVRDVITFDHLIRAFCMKGKVVESLDLLHELLAQGLQPSASSYAPIIKNLCRAGHIKETQNLLNDMQSRSVELKVCTHDHVIAGLCEQGYVAEGLEWFREMLKNQLKPQQKTLEKLVRCLSERDRFDDSLLVLDFMFRLGYALNLSICHSIVTKFCQRNAHLVEPCLDEVLEIN